MRAVIQRVTRASVTVDGETVGSVGPGLVVLLGVADGDGPEQANRQRIDRLDEGARREPEVLERTTRGTQAAAAPGTILRAQRHQRPIGALSTSL